MGVPLFAVDVDVEVPGHAEREEVDRRPTDDLIRTQVDCEERMDERQRAAGCHRDQEPSLPRAGLVRSQRTEEGAHQHHPLQADVHHAAAFGEHAPDRGESQRSGPPKRRGDERSPEDDDVEVREARSRCEDSARDPEERGGDGAPADPALASRRGPDSRRRTHDSDGNGYKGSARVNRRKRKPEGERAERDAEDPYRSGSSGSYPAVP